MSFEEAGQLESIREKSSRLLLGVTGSIATGKSTVANILAELGAPMIDFDLLARKVVEPAKPAWKDIIDFFGEEVLNRDKSLNRKALSDIVFNQPEKRKKLESFTHPRIQECFINQLDEITKKDANAIIQVVVPLLIEVKMQSLFDKLLVVYATPEIQVKRLMKRDSITEQQAIKILSTQISIDEKVTYADYVIHNEKSLADTRRQVEELWVVLREAQKQRKYK